MGIRDAMGKLALAAAALWLAACGRSGPLPVMGDVPSFQLTSQSGQSFERKTLDGSVWVADFFFTTCTGPCPRMTAQMRTVQKRTADLPGVKLVSFTVDPKRDTPTVLAEYAKRFQADPARWFFLTGETAVLDGLARNTFKLNNVDGSLVHSTRFVLVDRKSRIRGVYASTDDDFLSRLVRDIRSLEREPS